MIKQNLIYWKNCTEFDDDLNLLVDIVENARYVSWRTFLRYVSIREANLVLSSLGLTRCLNPRLNLEFAVCTVFRERYAFIHNVDTDIHYIFAEERNVR